MLLLIKTDAMLYEKNYEKNELFRCKEKLNESIISNDKNKFLMQDMDKIFENEFSTLESIYG